MDCGFQSLASSTNTLQFIGQNLKRRFTHSRVFTTSFTPITSRDSQVYERNCSDLPISSSVSL